MITNKLIGGILAFFSIILILLLAFVKEDIDKQGAFLCEMVAEDPSLEMKDCPVHGNNSSWPIIIGFSLAILLLGLGTYLFFMNPQEFAKKHKKIDLSKLDSDEKKIYEIIKNKEGSIYQSDLVKETNFSKVKLTRILDKMENKEILERKRRGMTNLVILK